MAPHWVTVVLICLATHRATRFITRDAFPLVRWPREWIDVNWGHDDDTVRRLKAAKLQEEVVSREEGRANQLINLKIPNVFQRSFAYLVTCDWCTSIWVSAGLVAGSSYFLHIGWVWQILLWLTASTVTGLIAQKEPE